MATQKEDVYATLLMNDTYLPGALVLAHSLKDAGTKKKLAVLVTTDGVSADAMAELRKLFDYIIPVERLVNHTPQNLSLMNRLDLHSTFTKILLWRQVQFRRIVYMDADMVALRAPDELFSLPQPFSAAPDIGWPDLFNTGLMVLNPNMGDYYALLAMAQRGISFDGADQGLLNMHFKNTYNRIPFTYNVTPSAHYQYIPAYRHFQSSISAAHFIGKEKPWTQGREASKGTSPYDEMLGMWWSVYDKHYRDSYADSSKTPHILQYLVKGEMPAFSYTAPASTEAAEREIPHEVPYATSYPASHPASYEAPPTVSHEVSHEVRTEEPAPFQEQPVETHYEKIVEAEPAPEHFSAPVAVWDAARAPPPTHSKPEASNFPSTHYEMSQDYTPFKAPEKYPEPPKDMYYEVPKTPSYQKPAQIFPWETNQAPATRVFAEDAEKPAPAVVEPVEEELEPVEAAKPPANDSPADPWLSFGTQANAWDNIPEIERYIGALQKNRKGNIQVLQGYGVAIDPEPSPGGRRPSTKLTDFPTELERPSLPVTPAPIRRPSFWGQERDEEGELPAADGVPAQSDWDPAARLEALARRQSDVLATKLGKEDGREIPMRPLPYGSEGVKSPTYVPPVPVASTSSATAEPLPKVMEQPSFAGSMPTFEKGETFPTQEKPLGPTEEELDALEN